MYKYLSELLERTHSWPAEAQDELERMACEIEAKLSAGPYKPSPEEIAGIRRGLSDVAAGKFATDAEV
jgi:hypothetical protein